MKITIVTVTVNHDKHVFMFPSIRKATNVGDKKKHSDTFSYVAIDIHSGVNQNTEPINMFVSVFIF